MLFTPESKRNSQVVRTGLEISSHSKNGQGTGIIAVPRNTSADVSGICGNDVDNSFAAAFFHIRI